MHHYKIIVCNLLILPIINFAFSLPITVHEMPQEVGGDLAPDVAITMSAKRADKMEELLGMHFERVSGKPDSDLEGLKGLLHYGPELTKSPSLDHYLLPVSPELTRTPSLDHYLTSSAPLDNNVVSTKSEAGPSRSAASESGSMTSSSSLENPESKSLLSKVVNKLKFWRRISGPGSVRDTVNAAQRELQGLV